VPKRSGWEWDPHNQIQYRRVDGYLSESQVKIQMRPGDNPDLHTWTFHRPLQWYFKTLRKYGFSVSGLEEWNSNRVSQPGPRSIAENRARKEIPLFLFMECKVGN